MLFPKILHHFGNFFFLSFNGFILEEELTILGNRQDPLRLSISTSTVRISVAVIYVKAFCHSFTGHTRT